MGKNWSEDWSARDRFIEAEAKAFKAGLPDVRGLDDLQLRAELEKLNDLYAACRSQEAARPNQPITREVIHRIDLVRDELQSRARAADVARAEASLREDRKSNFLSILALVVALISLAVSVFRCGEPTTASAPPIPSATPPR